MKSKVAIVVGTRPEAIKLIPVHEALRRSNIDPIMISSGQHREMLASVYEAFGVVPDITLDTMASNQSLAGLTVRLIDGLEPVLRDEDYKLVVVQGDTTTAFAGALVAHYERIPIAHVEAGLRTNDKWAPFPEESNRRMIGALADLHFAATSYSADALARENVREGVNTVGNTVVDAVLMMHRRVMQRKEYYQGIFESLIGGLDRYILVTGHRRESFGDGFENICAALIQVSKKFPDLKIVYSVHLNPNVKEIVYERLEGVENIHLLPPLPYDQMVFLMAGAWLILTDSGGIQEEAPSLNVPVLVMREKSERMEGVYSGGAKLVGTEVHRIVDAVSDLYDDPHQHGRMVSAANPFGDGETSNRIAQKIAAYLSERRLSSRA